MWRTHFGSDPAGATWSQEPGTSAAPLFGLRWFDRKAIKSQSSPGVNFSARLSSRAERPGRLLFDRVEGNRNLSLVPPLLLAVTAGESPPPTDMGPQTAATAPVLSANLGVSTPRRCSIVTKRFDRGMSLWAISFCQGSWPPSQGPPAGFSGPKLRY